MSQDDINTPRPDDVDGPRAQALQRLEQQRGFRTHLITYVLVNLLLWGIWLVAGVSSGSWYPWPLWVTFGWGIGLVANGWAVHRRRPIDERRIREEMERVSRVR